MAETNEPRWLRILGGAIQNAINLVFLTGSIIAVTQSYEKYHSAKYSLYCAFCSWGYVWFPAFYDKAWMG